MTSTVEAAANLMVRDYLILAFLASVGSLQIATSISGIRGLWIIPHPILTRSLGFLLITLGLVYYILGPLWIEGPWAAGSVVDGTSENRQWGTATFSEVSGARNLNDIHGGMAGTAYAGFFILSAVLATAFSAIIGTFNQRLFPSSSFTSEPNADGLDALKRSDAVSTFFISISSLRKTGVGDAHKFLQSSHRWSIPSPFGRKRRD